MNHYETVFILNPVLSDEQTKETVLKYEKFLTSKGAKFVSIEDWGLKGTNFFPSNEAFVLSTYPNYLNIEEGDLVLFPSYLTHFVKRSRAQHGKLRVSYAFNVENHSLLCPS